MRRTIAIICAALLGAGAAGLAALASSVSAAVQPGHTAQTSQTQLEANQRAARRDAAQLLRLLKLPADVTPIRAVPAFARSFGVSSSLNGKYYAGDQRWALSSAPPQAIIAHVREHPPAGSTADVGTGTSSDSRTGVNSIDVQFSWPNVGQQLMNRSLTLTVITPPHGDSVVLAQAQSAWVVPRSLSERVPAGVHAVLITLRLGPPATGPVVKPSGHVHTSRYLVWRTARVRRLVDTFNGLGIVQPSTSALACPLMLTGPSASSLTLAFKTGHDGATLARAQVYLHPGSHGGDGAGPCNPINFWIGATQQTPLLSDTFVARVGRLIGARIS